MKPAILLAFLLVLAASVHAEMRTSADYTITADTLDSGGQRTTSANYTNDGSIGGIVGLSTVSSPAETVKSGYIGQLYDIAGLSVVPATGTASVAGGGTLQLAAYEVLDDSSLLAVPAGSVAWSVKSGPISGVSAAGLATAGSVSQNVPAVVQGMYGGFTGTLDLTVLGLTQSITFSPIATHSVGDAAFALQATSSSGLPVTFSVYSGPATISGNMVTVTGAGEVTIEAECTGPGFLPAPDVFQSFLVASSSGQFTGLGDLAGGTVFSTALGVSNGGIVVAGAVDDGSIDAAEWTGTGGLQGLQIGSASVQAAANAVSADGSTLAGTGNSAGQYSPFIYTALNGVNFLGNLTGFTTGSAQAVSSGGSAVAGYSSNSAPGPGITGTLAFQWTASGGLIPLGSLFSGGASRADGISGDGTILVGTSQSGVGGSSTEAFRWAAATSMQGLGALPFTPSASSALAISADGSTIVGRSFGGMHNQACVWSGANAPAALQELPNTKDSAALAVCGDGSIIVGYCTVGGKPEATIWLNWQSGGAPQTVQSLLSVHYGLTSALTNWNLTSATAISSDGYAVAGAGTDPQGHSDGWEAVVPRESVVAIASPAPVNEGATSVTVTVTKSAGAATDVTYQIIPGTAIQLAGGFGDYDATNATNSNPSQTLANTVHFGTSDTSQTITIPLRLDLAVAPGASRSFTVALTGTTPAPGATISSGAASATVTIVNPSISPPYMNLSPQTPPSAAPTQTATLQVNLIVPSGGTGGWRLQGETAWRLSGTTIAGLALDGEYVVEFEPITVSGTPQPTPPPQAVALTIPDSQGANVASFTYPTGTAATGMVTVTIKYADGDPGGLVGQWRISGEMVWHNTGTSETLAAGSYAVEFTALLGYETASDTNVLVTPGQTTAVTVNYIPAATPVGELPQVVTLATATTVAPFCYAGQLQTDIGDGSGYAVEQQVVLTAAHVLFDDNKLTALTGTIDPTQLSQDTATGVRWRLEQMQGQYEPVPIAARGFYALSGYAAAREGATPGAGIPASQELDVAAAYFDLAVARNGAGGYLESDANNDWVQSGRKATFISYPEDTTQYSSGGINPATVGQMHACPLPAAPLTFSQPYGAGTTIYGTTDIAGLAGSSGGALCVQFDDGQYYPAAVYIGIDGSGESIFRVIDANVVDIIGRAVVSSQGGQNNDSGGIVQVTSAASVATATAAQVTVNITPSAAIGTGATCTLVPVDATTKAPLGPGVQFPSGTAETLQPGTYTLELGAAGGYLAPKPYTFTIQDDDVEVLAAIYDLLPVIATNSLPPAIVGQPYDVAIMVNNPSAVLTATATALAGTGITLNSAGHLVAAAVTGNSEVGEQTIEVTFTATVTTAATPPVMASVSKTLSLNVLQPAQLTLGYDNTEGTVTGTPHLIDGANPNVGQGETIRLTAVPKRGFLFAGWTLIGAAAPAEPLDAKLVFVIPQGTASVSVQAAFVPNPFLATAGSYKGVVVLPSAPTVGDAGVMTVALTSTGSFTLKLNLGGVSYGKVGKMDFTGAYTGTVSRGRKFSAAGVQLSLATATDATGTSVPLLQGTLALDGQTVNVNGHRALHGKALEKGTFTLALPRDPAMTDPTQYPYGHGYGTMTVSVHGAVVAAGQLGDGSPWSAGGAFAQDDVWVLYTRPYAGKGALAGEVDYQPGIATASDTLIGGLTWLKPATNKGAFLGAVNGTIQPEGSRFTAPGTGGIVLSFGSGSATGKLTLADGSLINEQQAPIAAFGKSLQAGPTGSTIQFKVNPANGRITGMFTAPVNGTSSATGAVTGVVLQAQGAARGNFGAMLSDKPDIGVLELDPE